MKSEVFHIPGSVRIERCLCREGPPVVFNVWKPHSSMSFTETRPLLKFVAWPKSTTTGTEIRAWLAAFEAKAAEKTKAADAEHAKRVISEGFGPEAHGEEEPNDNTKTIV